MVTAAKAMGLPPKKAGGQGLQGHSGAPLTPFRTMGSGQPVLWSIAEVPNGPASGSEYWRSLLTRREDLHEYRAVTESFPAIAISVVLVRLLGLLLGSGRCGRLD